MSDSEKLRASEEALLKVLAHLAPLTQSKKGEEQDTQQSQSQDNNTKNNNQKQRLTVPTTLGGTSTAGRDSRSSSVSSLQQSEHEDDSSPDAAPSTAKIRGLLLKAQAAIRSTAKELNISLAGGGNNTVQGVATSSGGGLSPRATPLGSSRSLNAHPPGTASRTVIAVPPATQQLLPSTVVAPPSVTLHVASTLFIMLDTLSSAIRASWGMLYMYNDTLRKLVLVCSTGQRYAKPGSITVAVHLSLAQQQSLQKLGTSNNNSSTKGLNEITGGSGEDNNNNNNSSGRQQQSNTANSGCIESHVVETGVSVNLLMANVERLNEDMDRAFHARELAAVVLAQQEAGVQNAMAQAASGGTNNHSTSSPTSPTVSRADTVAATAQFSSKVGAAHRTRSLLLMPVFKPGSHNTEVIGLLQFGNKIADEILLAQCTGTVAEGSALLHSGAQSGPQEGPTNGNNKQHTSEDGKKSGRGNNDDSHNNTTIVYPPFTHDDECRVSEAALMFANVMAKHPHDLAGRYNHNHGINHRLAQMLAGHAPPAYMTALAEGCGRSAEAGREMAYFNHYVAAVLRTSALRTQQLMFRSQPHTIASVRKADVRGNAQLLLKDNNTINTSTNCNEQAGINKSTNNNTTNVNPPHVHLSAAGVPPFTSPTSSIIMPRYDGIDDIKELLQHTVTVTESWKSAVMLNIELETEIRRLHEALRVSRREVARLQEIVRSLWQR